MKNNTWAINPQKRTAARNGITFRFDRHEGGWICNCLTPGNLNAYIGDGQDMGERLASIADDALKAWKQVVVAGHSRHNCPHLGRSHPWSKCPANREAIA